MQKNKKDFKGQNIYVGIDVHLKTWHVTTVTESGYKYSFAQHSDARELFDRLNRKFPDAHFLSAYEAGFCGFSVHYALTELGFENIVVHAADIPTTGKEKAMKTDAVDSEKIAWALKRGELKGLMHLCDQVEDTRRAILAITREICRLSTTDRYRGNYELLTSVPGFGLILSMSMLTELDNDVTRFPNECSFVSMLGLIPMCHDSGEKKAVGEKTNRGNKQLGPLIIEASWVAIQKDKGLGAYYCNCCQRMKPHKAIIMVARKLACRAYAVLKTKTKYKYEQS